MNKTRSHLHMFWNFFKSNTIWIKFAIFSSLKILLWFYFLFHFSLWPISNPSPIFLAHLILLAIFFFTGPISTSDQPCTWPTDLISFDYLRPTAASCRFRPNWLPCHTLLCHTPPAPWSCLAFSPSPPPKMAAPYRFSVSISRSRSHSRSTTAAPIPLTARLPPPYNPIKCVTIVPSLSTTPTQLQSLLLAPGTISPSEHH
jgi:hypothetical protein